MTVQACKALLTPGRRAHLVGIGGVSMYPLSQVLLGMGLEVTGSDFNPDSPNVRHLKEQGVPVYIGHHPENVEGAELVIRTAAVHDDNPEIVAARQGDIPVFERSQAWGAISLDYRHSLCIAGTHGKTSTTSMAAHIVLAAGLDPTVMIGANLPALGSGYRVGKGDTIILESCEYRNSFLSFRPTTAVILDIEADHLDFFKDLADIERSFRSFAALVPEQGMVIASADDRNTMDTLEGLNRPLLTFGLGSYADVYCENLSWERGLARFDLMTQEGRQCRVELSVPGLYNVKNALAASAAALTMGINGAAIARGLKEYRGAERRFEYKGECNGAQIYDDYAHHPSEISALLDMAETLGYERVICAFQPHTYTRTKALFSDFVQVLAKADKTILAEIYAARETDTLGVSSRDLAERIPGGEFCPGPEDVERRLRELARPGDLILTVGAGELNRVAERLAE